jgi:hypothetical protein
MPRSLTIKTNELMDLSLYLIYQYGDNWEEEWKPLQGSSITSLLTLISQEDMTHALKGWTKPLFKALGLAPEFALRKLPNFNCDKKKICRYYDKKNCTPKSKKMPWCFEPSGIEDLEARRLGGELIRLWREGVYVVVVVHQLVEG